MTVQRALKLVEKEYEQAKKLEWIRNPLAYALFKVWRLVEKEAAKNGRV